MENISIQGKPAEFVLNQSGRLCFAPVPWLQNQHNTNLVRMAQLRANAPPRNNANPSTSVSTGS